MKKIILTFVALVAFAAGADELSAKIPYPFHAEQGGNEVLFVDDGITAFEARLEMIRRAKRTIEVEYFIYNVDTAGRIFSKELVEAAARGVRVRVLIDKSEPIFVFNEYYAKEMKARGVEVRYYNAAALWRVSTIQFRDHRKLLVIDDEEAVTGGRNIADEYFDMNHEFNFDDADVFVRGPVARAMRDSFDLFWTNHLSEHPKVPRASVIDPFHKYAKGTRAAREFFGTTTALETEANARLMAAASPLAARTYAPCETTTFATDAPGADFIQRLKHDFVDTHRYLRKTLFDKISAVDQRIVVDSPYIIDSSATDEMTRILEKNGAQIDLYTNSLGSTDATYVAANMYLGLKRWRAKGMNVWLHDGKFLGYPGAPKYVRDARSGTHSKVQVYQTHAYSEVMVGTYNVDHRSNYYNAEMALFCRGSDAFTADVLRSIELRMHAGLEVNASATAATDSDGRSHSIYAADISQIRDMKLKTLFFWLARELL